MNFIKRDLSQTLAKKRQIWSYVSCNILLVFFSETYVKMWPASNSTGILIMRTDVMHAVTSSKLVYKTVSLLKERWCWTVARTLNCDGAHKSSLFYLHCVSMCHRWWTTHCRRCHSFIDVAAEESAINDQCRSSSTEVSRRWHPKQCNRLFVYPSYSRPHVTEAQ